VEIPRRGLASREGAANGSEPLPKDGAGVRRTRWDPDPTRRKVMKVKVLLCNCKGLCPSFGGVDMNTLPFELESDMDIEYSVLHP
jgi:hypothetical protein